MKRLRILTNLFIILLSLLLASCDNDDKGTDLPMGSIGFVQEQISLVLGEEIEIETVCSGEEVKKQEFTWSSQQPDIIRIDPRGASAVITALKEGETRLTVTSEDQKLSATCVIKVRPVEAIYFDKSLATLEEEEALELKLLFSEESLKNKKFTWSVEDASLLNIEEQRASALIKGLKKGETTVKVSSEDKILSAECRIVVTKANKGLVRILGIGNSFTVDAMQNYLHELIRAEGREAIVAYAQFGGATLEDHLYGIHDSGRNYQCMKIGTDGKVSNTSNRRIVSILAEEPWDYICIQEQSENSYRYESYKASLPQLVEAVKEASVNANTTYALLQCWAYAGDYPSQWTDFEDYFGRDQMKMYTGLVDVTTRAAALINPKMEVLPIGTAIQNGRSSLIGDQFCRDGYHLHIGIGRFTAACTWYEFVFGNVAGNPYHPASLSPEHSRIAKQAARYALMKPMEVTDMGDTQ